MPAPQKLHGVLSDIGFRHLDDKDEDWNKAKDYFNSRNFTPEMYHDLMTNKYHSGTYGFGDSGVEGANKVLQGHPFNNEQNNDKILEELLSQNHADQTVGNLKGVLENLKISPNKLTQVIYQGKHKEKFPDVALNPSFNRNHLEQLINNDRIPLKTSAINSPHMDEALFERMLNRERNKPKAVELSDHKLLKPEHAEKILNKVNELDVFSLDRLLDKMPEDKRHEWIKNKLGMTGGEHENELGAYLDPEEYGWDNWKHGPESRSKLHSTIAESKHLRPEEIEHIKRHGGFESKYNLLNNTDIDPKHAEEMWYKWADNDSHHGYDESDLKYRLRKDLEGDKWEYFNEDAREKAEEKYPLDKFLDQQSNNYKAKHLLGHDNYNDWKESYMAENNVDDDVADDAFDEVVENKASEGDTPDRVMDDYNESLNEDINRHTDNLFNDELDNFGESDYFTPEHIKKSIKKQFNVDDPNLTPEQLQIGLDSNRKKHKEGAIQHPNIAPEQLTGVLNLESNTHNNELKRLALKHPKIDANHLKIAAKDENESVSRAAIRHPKLDPNTLSEFVNDKESPGLVEKALQNPNVTSEDLTNAINNHIGENEVVESALNHRNSNDSHAKQIMDAIRSKKQFNGDVINRILNPKFNHSQEDLNAISSQHNLSGRDFGKMINHPSASREMIEGALNHPSGIVRDKAKDIMGKKYPQIANPVKVKLGTHKLRVLRDVIEQNGGKLSKSKLKALGVNTTPIDKLFKPNGTIESQDIQTFIDQTPSTEYNTSNGEWDGDQRHNGEPSKVFHLNYNQHLLDEMNKAGVLGTFHNIHDVSFRSGHPVKPNTIGWVRYTGDPQNGFHIDEIQTDLGKSLIEEAAKQTKEAQKKGLINSEEADTINERAKDKYPDGHLQKIINIMFNGKHPSEIIHEAFKEHLRNNGMANAPIHIWQPKGKAPASHQVTEETINPENAKESLNAFKDGTLNSTTEHKANALVSWGQKHKILPPSQKDITPEHLDALHTAFTENLQNKNKTEVTLPVPLPVHMQEGYGKIPKAMGYEESTYGDLPTQTNEEYKGLPTTKEIVRKSEDVSPNQLKLKAAYTLKIIDENKEVLNSLQQSNPQAYESLMSLVQSLVEVFKQTTNEDPQQVLQEEEQKRQIAEQQAQMQQGQEEQSSPPVEEASAGGGHLAWKDNPVHGRKIEFAPGSRRDYNPHDSRIKQDDGSWKSFGGGVQEGQGGEGGQ